MERKGQDRIPLTNLRCLILHCKMLHPRRTTRYKWKGEKIEKDYYRLLALHAFVYNKINLFPEISQTRLLNLISLQVETISLNGWIKLVLKSCSY